MAWDLAPVEKRLGGQSPFSRMKSREQDPLTNRENVTRNKCLFHPAVLDTLRNAARASSAERALLVNWSRRSSTQVIKNAALCGFALASY